MDYMAWLQSQSVPAIIASRRAIYAWNRIQRNPVSITVSRNNVTQAAQTVRIVFNNSQVRSDDSGDTPVSGPALSVSLFGVTGHPSDTVADTDLRAEDLFAIGGVRYRVISVGQYPGEIHAKAEALG